MSISGVNLFLPLSDTATYGIVVGQVRPSGRDGLPPDVDFVPARNLERGTDQTTATPRSPTALRSPEQNSRGPQEERAEDRNRRNAESESAQKTRERSAADAKESSEKATARTEQQRQLLALQEQRAQETKPPEPRPVEARIVDARTLEGRAQDRRAVESRQGSNAGGPIRLSSERIFPASLNEAKGRGNAYAAAASAYAYAAETSQLAYRRAETDLDLTL